MSYSYYDLHGLLFFDEETLNLIVRHNTEYEITPYFCFRSNSYYLKQTTNAETFLNWYGRKTKTFSLSKKDYLHKIFKICDDMYVAVDYLKDHIISKSTNDVIYRVSNILSKEEFFISASDLEKLL